MKIAKSWSDVTIKQFSQLQEAMAMDWTDDTERVAAYMSALSGEPISYFTDEISVATFKRYAGYLKFISDKRSEQAVSPTVKVGRKRFAVDLSIKDSAASSFIDIATLTKDKENMKYHEILAIFFTECYWFGWKKKRTASSHKEIAEYLFENCTMDIVFKYSSFFLRSYNKLLKATQDFLDAQNLKMAKMLRRELNRLS